MVIPPSGLVPVSQLELAVFARQSLAFDFSTLPFRKIPRCFGLFRILEKFSAPIVLAPLAMIEVRTNGVQFAGKSLKHVI